MRLRNSRGLAPGKPVRTRGATSRRDFSTSTENDNGWAQFLDLKIGARPLGRAGFKKPLRTPFCSCPHRLAPPHPKQEHSADVWQTASVSMNDVMTSLQRSRQGIPSETSDCAGQSGADGGTAVHAGRWGPSRNAKRAGLVDLEQHVENMHIKPLLAAAPLESLHVASSGRDECNQGSRADKPSVRRNDFCTSTGQIGLESRSWARRGPSR